jgi:hypothetical protein
VKRKKHKHFDYRRLSCLTEDSRIGRDREVGLDGSGAWAIFISSRSLIVLSRWDCVAACDGE